MNAKIGLNDKVWLNDEQVHFFVSDDTLKVYAYGGSTQDEDGDLVEVDTDYLVCAIELSEGDLEALDNGEYELTIPESAIEKLSAYRAEYPFA